MHHQLAVTMAATMGTMEGIPDMAAMHHFHHAEGVVTIHHPLQLLIVHKNAAIHHHPLSHPRSDSSIRDQTEGLQSEHQFTLVPLAAATGVELLRRGHMHAGCLAAPLGARFAGGWSFGRRKMKKFDAPFPLATSRHDGSIYFL